jgi:hypothetical protein
MKYEVIEEAGQLRVVRGWDVVEVFPSWVTRQEAEAMAARLNGNTQNEELL